MIKRLQITELLHRKNLLREDGTVRYTMTDVGVAAYPDVDPTTARVYAQLLDVGKKAPDVNVLARLCLFLNCLPDEL